MVTTIFRNIRHALRVLARAPGFSLTAIATLALGIGAATAMFTIVNSVLLRPLPFGDADRVVAVWTRYEASSGFDFAQFPLSGPEFIDYRAQTRALEEVAAFNRAATTFTTDDAAAQPIRGLHVVGTANLFTTLGVQPAMGRTFRDGDGPAGRGVRRRVESRLVARRVRRRPERGRAHRALGRHAVRGRRHHAGGFRVSGQAGARCGVTRSSIARNPLWGQRGSHNWSASRAARARRHVRRGGSRGAHVRGQLEGGRRPPSRALRVPASLPRRNRRQRSARARRCCSAPWGSWCS